MATQRKLNKKNTRVRKKRKRRKSTITIKATPAILKVFRLDKPRAKMVDCRYVEIYDDNGDLEESFCLKLGCPGECYKVAGKKRCKCVAIV